ncbi:heterokaryon incompatibility protein-domain-containing protein [Halenospora varia]|nr:heterokaryon incompatibility protein-domain-containing protein [Halenospora varia]
MATLSSEADTGPGLELGISTTHCRLCNDLSADRRMESVPLKEWIEGITQSSCGFCHILAQSIQKLDPDFLTNIPESHGDLKIQVYPPLQALGRKVINISLIQNGGGTARVHFELYVEEGALSDLPLIGSGQRISPTAGDERMWTFLQDCFRQCSEHHSICSGLQDSEWYPDRLLHVKESRNGDGCILQLIESHQHKPASRYIALSHCWGPSVPLCTTTGNADHHRRGIIYDQLPRTFQDCVTVARKFGVQYIWIDSLCIIQNQRSDWAHHAGLMDRVYENAVFTVTAVSSPSSSTPFLGPDSPSERGKFQSHTIDISALAGNDSTVMARTYEPRLLSGFVNGPLEYRAWAWQERHLSIRTIDFTEQEVHWKCAAMNTCECTGVKDIKLLKTPEKVLPKTIRAWRGTVESYSGRHLTYWTDRLPAMSGMASRFSVDLGSEYVAGLWLSDFPRCLAWYRRELSDCPVGKPCMWRSINNGVPSWSWASIASQVWHLWTMDFDNSESRFIDGNIKELNDDEVLIRNCVELVAHDCHPLDPENAYGEVKPGSFLEIKGQVIEAIMESDVHGCGLVRRQGLKPQLVVPDCHIVGKDNLKFKTSDIFHQQRRSSALRRALPEDKLKGSEGQRSIGPVTCLLLFTSEKNNKTVPCILMLSKDHLGISSINGTKPVYQRVGIGAGSINYNGPLYNYRKDWECWEGWEDLDTWEDWEEWFAGVEEKTLRIV